MTYTYKCTVQQSISTRQNIITLSKSDNVVDLLNKLWLRSDLVFGSGTRYTVYFATFGPRHCNIYKITA